MGFCIIFIAYCKVFRGQNIRSGDGSTIVSQTSEHKAFIELVKGLGTVLEGGVVTMHEGVYEQDERADHTNPSALWKQSPTDRS